MEHTADCKKSFADRQTWLDKWPDHCDECGGNGVLSYRENMSPLGSGEYWPMSFSEPCSKCYEQGNCPRCGAVSVFPEDADESQACSACGWTVKAGGVPEAECFCWHNEYEDAEIPF